jgi:hypothetical protein
MGLNGRGRRLPTLVTMASLLTHAVGHAVGRVPGLRRIPVLRLLALGEVVLLVRDHFAKLEPAERRRIVELVRRGRGRSSRLSERERDELGELIAKAEPRLLVGQTADKLSPVPLPKRVLYGPRRRRP